MKIVLVIDQYDICNNGTSVTARRFASELRERGHTVVVLASGEPEEDKITVPEWHVPVFNNLITSQGMDFAKPDDNAYRKAFDGADIVHFFLPFRFCRHGEKIARQMGIPTIGAFHMQPESITFTIGLGNCKAANDLIYKWCYKGFYKRFSHIHCPSRFIAGQLKQHGYDAKLHVISNGVGSAFVPQEEKQKQKSGNKFTVLMIGRLSAEKRQDLIIEAARLSRYSDRLQLIFAGKGPKEATYKKQAKCLINPPVFGFYSQNELISLINGCDLYVHASDAETEGISCMEAFSCGLVPVISDSPRSATNQYALNEHCLFRAGDANSLAGRLDYWTEHPDKRQTLGAEYAQLGNTLRVNECVRQAEGMYEEAIEDYKKYGYKNSCR